MIYSKDFYLTRTCEFHAAVAVGLPTISLSMILVTLFLALTAGLWNKPTRLKSMRTGRCACNLWCFENRMECPLNSEVWNSILILSCLSALLPVAEGHAMQALLDIQGALNHTKLLFQRSNASLYTPNTEDINICTYKFFDCFLMEMNVLLHDEDPTDENKLKLMLERTLEEYNQKVWAAFTEVLGATSLRITRTCPLQ
ncbi:interleukin-15 isoform X2 [Puntigrus tetrazona]|uniref:interleukin-15 isoform X2 n=1 Tax=Puntigrus tetrazona TaxID=1606681 RepID=UPI001C89CAEB|nr:interleukin-15 isoform X2 [Puntigrus tetrazona]